MKRLTTLRDSIRWPAGSENPSASAPVPTYPAPAESAAPDSTLTQTLNSMARLRAVTDLLASALTPHEIARIVVDQGSSALRAASGTVVLLNESETGLTIIHPSEEPDEGVRPYLNLTLGAPVPSAEVVRSGQPIWLSTRAEVVARFPAMAAAHYSEQCEAVCAVPLFGGEGCVGAIAFSFDEARDFGDDDRSLTVMLARQCSQALERARLYGAEREARIAAEEAERALRSSEERYRHIVETAQEGIWTVDSKGRTTFVNQKIVQILGYTAAEMMGQPIAAFTGDEGTMAPLDLLQSLPAGQSEARLRRKDGTRIWTRMSTSPFRGEDGELRGALAMVTDITERKRAEDALRQREEQYRSVIEASLDAIARYDLNGTITFVNRQMVQLLGYDSADDLVGRYNLSIVAEADRQRVLSEIRNVVERGSVSNVHCTLLRQDQSSVPVELNGSLMRDDDGMPVGITSVIRDVTERQEYQQQLEHQALHDVLTGLPNRALLRDRVTQAIAAAQRGREPVSLLLMDLNRFKEVNDTFGHHYGDLILQEVGKRLRSLLRDSDTVSRLGGDEFAVLLPDADVRGAGEVAGKISRALGEPLEVDGKSIYVAASVGIAHFPEHGSDLHTLLRRADVAMYVAKRRDRGFVVYEPGLDTHSPARLRLVADLREAIDRRQLHLHYQPTIDVRTGRVTAVEALVRWDHPEHGSVPPLEFVELAENVGLIKPLTRWILGEAVRQSAEWRRVGPGVPVAVNLSAQNLHDPHLIDLIADTLSTHQTDSGALAIEITESGIMSNPDVAMDTVKRLHNLGVAVSIDDFGTGYSSLSYLRQLPAAAIKIDTSFVRTLDDSDDDAVIVRSVIDLGHRLGRIVVAEGVESQRILELLLALGCDHAQGYHVSRPLPTLEMTAWLARAIYDPVAG